MHMKNISTFDRKLVSTAILGSLCVIAAFRFAALSVSPDGTTPLPQPDTGIYCQAAARIAEGHPFSYSVGEPVCTGTTSVLYPFALAVPYLCGATGDALLTAGFLLNALFLAVFVWGWATAFRAWTDDPRIRLTAATLTVLSAQAANGALAQSDTGMMMAVGALFAAGLATGRRALLAAALLAGPWVRPEGMMCAVAFIVGLSLLTVLRRRLPSLPKPSRSDFLLAALGIASTMGVFLLNLALTGEAQFSSVSHKGHFTTFGFIPAVVRTFADAATLFRTYFTGSSGGFRDFITPPVFGALLVSAGLVGRRWHRDRATCALAVFACAAALSFVSVATSGWQGTNFDRYLAWTVPLLALFTAEGAVVIGDRLPRTVRHLPAVAIVLFAAVTLGVSVCHFAAGSAACDRLRLFGAEVRRHIGPDDSLGGGSCNLAYFTGSRRFAHLGGIYSPAFDFADPSPAAAFEKLKRDPSVRFDWWTVSDRQDWAGIAQEDTMVFGTTELEGPSGYTLVRADWSAFDRAAAEPSVAPPPPVRLRARVDVGHAADEQRADYAIVDRWMRRPASPFVAVGKLDGARIVEGGRVIVGGDVMRVPLEPGKDVTVVMRTLSEHKAVFNDSLATEVQTCRFPAPVTMNVEVDDVAAGPVSFAYGANAGTNDFSDVTFKIPGSSIRTSPCRIAFLGDHIACDYRFYQ